MPGQDEGVCLHRNRCRCMCLTLAKLDRNASESNRRENQLVRIVRHGRHEDVYWTYSYSPIADAAAPHGVGGVLVVCAETTGQVENERRQAFLLQSRAIISRQVLHMSSLLDDLLGHEEDKRLALAAGFDHHLTKPMDPSRLELLLASAPSYAAAAAAHVPKREPSALRSSPRDRTA